MYRPAAFREENTDKLIAFMKANSFATLVSTVEGIPYASHIPLVVTKQGDAVKLTGHLAKQNPQWQAFAAAESLAVFTGAHAYISPTLYEKRENVPTWNYIAVHAYGIPEIITLADSPQRMDTMIGEMVNTYEATYQSQWRSLSDSYRTGMMSGIVGFEMTVTRLEGKFKLSQNRSQTDRQTVSDELLQSSDLAARVVGEEMKLRETGED